MLVGTMALNLRTLQWNIGGGKVRRGEAGPYDHDDLSHIIDTIQRLAPDIVTLQEAHTGNGVMQAATIAAATGLVHFVNDPYSQSHLEAGMQASQAILSRFPLEAHDFNFLPNPDLSATGPDGNRWVTFDKGVSRVLCQLPDGQDMDVVTLHAVPFGHFKRSPLDAEFAPIRHRLAELARPQQLLALVQGDFNNEAPTLADYVPDLVSRMTEAPLPGPTIPKGKYLDHVLYRGLTLRSVAVVTDVLTDHYPVLCHFDF